MSPSLGKPPRQGEAPFFMYAMIKSPVRDIDIKYKMFLQFKSKEI